MERSILIAAADEELGSELGIIYLVEECGLKFDVAIIPDGGRMDLSIYGEKGILWIELESHGIQAHGSTPELGRNAIVPLAEALAEIKMLDLGRELRSRVRRLDYERWDDSRRLVHQHRAGDGTGDDRFSAAGGHQQATGACENRGENIGGASTLA